MGEPRRAAQGQVLLLRPVLRAAPRGGDAVEWKEALGCAKRGDGKSFESKLDYYTRMGGCVYLYAALLQQSTAGYFAPPSEHMEVRPVVNPLGVAAAWRWLARLLNQKPRMITATILLAFLKPSAHALAAYPRQFGKLLRHCRGVFVAKMHALVDKAEAPEEKAALSNLETWLDGALDGLAAGRPLEIPTDSEMPAFKAPDDTRDAGEDAW